MSIARRGAIASSSSGGIAPGAGQIILATRVNYGNPSNEAQTAISGWGGNPSASIVHEYLNVASTWGTWPSSGVWSATGGFSPGFTGFPGARAISIPMQTTGAPLTWTDVTGGGQDTNWTSYFEWCVTNQVVYQRPGWEGNLSSATWPWATLGNDTTANQAGYVATWQHIWSLAHAVAPGYFKFIWCPDFPAGGSNMTTWEPGGAYYPGDSYVDFIGLDAYNTWAGGGSFPGDAAMLTALESGNAPNWNQNLAYAKAHSKGICLYEWGMNGDGSLPNGGDDPTWINNVSGLMVTAAQTDGLTVIAGVWDNVGASPISGYPNANTAVGTNVANWVSLGLTVGPASLTVNAVPTQAGVVGTAYSYTFGATGGTTPYTWTWTGEPAGLTLASNGVVSGTPTTVESTTVTVYATDAASHTAHTSYTFGVTAAPVGMTPYNPNGYSELSGFSSSNLVFDDEFTGTSLNLAKWSPYWYTDGSNIPGSGGFSQGYQANVSVGTNGLACSVNAAGNSGAIVLTGCPGGSTYPTSPTWLVPTASNPIYAECYIYVPGNGTELYDWTYMWWSPNTWPTGGETDILETGQGVSSSTLHTSVGGGNGGPHVVHPAGALNGNAWNHVAALVSPTEAIIYYNGTNISTLSGPLPGSGGGIALSLGIANYSGNTNYVAATAFFRYARVWQN